MSDPKSAPESSRGSDNPDLIHAIAPTQLPATAVTVARLRAAVAHLSEQQHRVLANPHDEPQVEPATWATATAASVLLPFVVESDPDGGDDRLRLLLTTRAQRIRYGGHVAFPGGKADAGDRDTTATALREANEEVGLHAADIDVIGVLPRYYTHASFCITGVVGLLRHPLSLKLDPAEVASAEERPMAEIFCPEAYERWERSTTPLRANYVIRRDGMHIGGPTVSLLIHLYNALVAVTQD